ASRRVMPLWRASSAWIAAKSGGGRVGSLHERGGYSRASSAASSSADGNGQLICAPRARRRHSCTVERTTPTLAAICRSVKPASYLRRSISRILRMDNLACATGDLLVESKGGHGSGGYPAYPWTDMVRNRG